MTTIRDSSGGRLLSDGARDATEKAAGRQQHIQAKRTADCQAFWQADNFKPDFSD